MQQRYDIEVIIDGRRRGIRLTELSNLQRPLWQGDDYYRPAARAVWEVLADLPYVTMVTPRPE
jgi:hypothetical protein